MFSVLKNSTYAKLFSAQIIALLGTGLLTVALGLLAFDISPSSSGAILGTAMTIKMVAYVFVSPVSNALAAKLPTKSVLIGADIVRALVAMALPFVSEAWHIYVLIFLLQCASATFTPRFQATIPAVLPQEREYTQALSLSRLAYDLESLVSPMIAAALLTIVTFNNLFLGTVVGFAGSAALVALSRIPSLTAEAELRFQTRLTQGTRAFVGSRDLRGLMGMNLAVSAPVAMVIVNSVVLVQADLGRSQTDLALLLAAYGLGSMIVAFSMTGLLDRVSDYRVMVLGASVLPVLLIAVSIVVRFADAGSQWWLLLALWLVMGGATAFVLTPSSRILRRASSESNRSAIFTAQFSLSHACYLVAYPLAGTVGARLGMSSIALLLAAVGVVGLLVTLASWAPHLKTKQLA